MLVHRQHYPIYTVFTRKFGSLNQQVQGSSPWWITKIRGPVWVLNLVKKVQGSPIRGIKSSPWWITLQEPVWVLFLFFNLQTFQSLYAKIY